ncbi:MAG: CBS domain-containing protein [Crenarchaeota archaeon]|nr:CBS domain-containing protein [Thermoproteota archaeon]MDW8034304.1 CBS domain-containing protein [Nitrososphaerota archaeon]
MKRNKEIRYIKGRQLKKPPSCVSKNSVLNYASSPPLQVTKTTPVLRLLETIVARGFRRIFVTTPTGILQGVVTPMEIVKYLLCKSQENLETPVLSIFSTSVSKIMRKDIISIRESESMFESIRLMKQKGINGLAVVDDNGLLKAVLTVRDVLEKFNYSLSVGVLRDFMSKSPICISSDRSLEEGIEIMVKSGYRRLPCLDGSNPIGLFSSRSVIRFLGGRELVKEAGKTLGELMSMSVISFTVRDIPVLDPEMSVPEAWETIKRSSYGSALVVKSGSLEGFITEMDFLKAIEV